MLRNRHHWLISCLAIALCALTTACGSAPAGNASVTDTVPGAQSPTVTASIPRLNGNATVVLQVNGQPITIVVDGQAAPLTAGNFVDLVQKGVYNGTAFHRVVNAPEPFVVQGGDPQSKDPKISVTALGTGSYLDAAGKPRYIPLEITPEGATAPTYSKTLKSAGINFPPQLKHTRGAVAMARSPLPDSASAQFYIALSQLDGLNGDYAVFGYVTSGMETVDRIKQGDRIESAQVTQGLENLKTSP
jgi:peptidyl-prolyl cis-trans isomerase B (cyclophilin B)